MKNNFMKTLIITTIICLLPMILSAILYDDLPDQIPIHFNSAGEPDNYASKALACYGLPAFFALFNLIIHIGLNIDPKKANQSNKLKTIGKWVIPVMAITLFPINLFIALGKNIPIQIVVPIFVGVLFIIAGNYLPKSRQNYTIGIKLPWTLKSEDNWNKTHRLAGFLWIVGGLIMIIFSLLGWGAILTLILILILLVLIPTVYSFCLYKKGI